MHAILFNTNLKKIHLVSLRYFQTDFPEFPIHILGKYYSPIFGWTYQMIEQYRYIMTLVDVFAHFLDNTPAQKAEASFGELTPRRLDMIFPDLTIMAIKIPYHQSLRD